MTHVLTIVLCLAGAGLLIGYLGMTGDMGGLTWARQMDIGLLLLWAGCLGAAVGVGFVRR